MKKSVLIAGILLAGLLWMVWKALRTLEQRSLYFPTRALETTPAAVGLPFENVIFETEDHQRLNAATSTPMPFPLF